MAPSSRPTGGAGCATRKALRRGSGGCLRHELDEVRLVRAMAARRLKTRIDPVGFMPGEASAFLLLEARSVAVSRTAPVPPPVIEGDHRSHSRKTLSGLKTGHGDGMAAAAAAALGLIGGAAHRYGIVFSDINGEPYRSADSGHAIVRLRRDGLRMIGSTRHRL